MILSYNSNSYEEQMHYLHNYYHRLTAITKDNLRQPAPPLKNWRILLEQSFTARMPLLMATSAYELSRRR